MPSFLFTEAVVNLAAEVITGTMRFHKYSQKGNGNGR
jgi:hypothetical protein